MAPDAQEKPQKPRGGSAIRTGYLILYNAVSAVLWCTVLGFAIAVPLYKSHHFVYPVANTFLRRTQTLAALEIVHSVLGLVRSPLLTTVMQVWSRYAIVWGVVFLFPSVAQSPAYTTMLLAWSATETIRYTYFALLLSSGGRASGVPAPLFWLRYNTFFILYPVGIISEICLVALAALGPARGTTWQLPMWAILATYLPGAPILYSHMMKQRRKVFRSREQEKKDS